MRNSVTLPLKIRINLLLLIRKCNNIFVNSNNIVMLKLVSFRIKLNRVTRAKAELENYFVTGQTILIDC